MIQRTCANVGQNIIEFREAKNISQKELALALDIRQATVSNWETGKVAPSKKMIQKLSKLFDIDPQFFTVNFYPDNIKNGETKENDNSQNISTYYANSGRAFVELMHDIPYLRNGYYELEDIDNLASAISPHIIPSNLIGILIKDDQLQTIGKNSIPKGSIALIEQKEIKDLNNFKNKLIAVLDDFNEVQLGFVKNNEGAFYLKRANPLFEDLFFSKNTSIFGVVVGFLKFFI